MQQDIADAKQDSEKQLQAQEESFRDQLLQSEKRMMMVEAETRSAQLATTSAEGHLEAAKEEIQILREQLADALSAPQDPHEEDFGKLQAQIDHLEKENLKQVQRATAIESRYRSGDLVLQCPELFEFTDTFY